MSKCESCKRNTTSEGWLACSTYIHYGGLVDRYEAVTIADHIRAMSDFELVEFLWNINTNDLSDVIKFCCSNVCDELDVDNITDGMCKRCLLAKLQQPYESPTGQKG